MKKSAILLAVCAASVAAHAQTILPQGSRAQLRVEYEYDNAGAFVSSAKDTKRDWTMKKRVILVGQYTAEKPQPFGVLHKDDGKQQAQISDLKGRVEATSQKMQPMAGDMMAIAKKCEREAAFEDCVTKAVNAYADNMKAPDTKANGAAIDSMTKDLSGTRFQSWKMATQSGTYSIDETLNKQVYEMTCTESKACRRTETRKGGGDLPAPPGGKSIAGAFWIEVDSQNKDMIVTLPMPMVPLDYVQTVVTTIPGDKDATQKTASGPWMSQLAKLPITVSIPANLRNVSGQKEIVLEGKYEDGGVLRVTWKFTRQ